MAGSVCLSVWFGLGNMVSRYSPGLGRLGLGSDGFGDDVLDWMSILRFVILCCHAINLVWWLAGRGCRVDRRTDKVRNLFQLDVVGADGNSLIDGDVVDNAENGMPNRDVYATFSHRALL